MRLKIFLKSKTLDSTIPASCQGSPLHTEDYTELGNLLQHTVLREIFTYRHTKIPGLQSTESLQRYASLAALSRTGLGRFQGAMQSLSDASGNNYGTSPARR